MKYHHMLFDRREIDFVEGAPCESFHPGHVGKGSFSDATHTVILELFPQLATKPAAFGPAARMSLKAHEVRVMTCDPGFVPQ